jgi:hypothetical protein
LSAVFFDRLDGTGANTRIELEPEVAAGAEVDPRLAVDQDRAAIEAGVLRRPEGDPALHQLFGDAGYDVELFGVACHDSVIGRIA